ncbi:MAG: type II toxin-antitoxin system RelE/ParE family toxin [Clostridiales Family XIII bacterium]|jgi:plasmid stabilization system protein ParE|nr:type II toxin-antitoxin system RelE/ParE family toxin [Clostridiales Family XIII bacterium]
MITNDYVVRVNHQAMMQLAEHVAFLSNVDENAAERLRRKLLEKFRSLEDNPYRCPVYDTEYTTEKYRKLNIDRYQILYSINENAKVVSIKYVWDTRSENSL